MATALLITGCNGQLGSEVARQAHQLKDVPFARGIDLPLDLTDSFTVRDTGDRRPHDPPQHRPRLPRRRDGPHEPDDLKGPTNAYGHTKLAGESAVRGDPPRGVVRRPDGLVLRRRRAQLREDDGSPQAEAGTLTVITDQVGSRT